MSSPCRSSRRSSSPTRCWTVASPSQNLLGATFVFGLRSEREAERALALLDLDPDDRRLRDALLEFDAGRCLMRDHRGRVEAVQVEVAVPRLLRALSTTPAPGAA